MKHLFILLFMGCLSTNLIAQDGWYWSTFMGGSISTHNSLKIRLNDQPDHNINAKYTSKSTSDSHWWMSRVEKRRGNKVWGFEMIHHKIYLQNTNDIIESFSVSDGYNLIYYNMGRVRNNAVYRFGLGIVLAHPDVKVVGRDPFHTPGWKGQFLAGPSIQFNAEKILWQNNIYFISLDSKLTLSYAWVPLSDQHGETAEAPDVAVHFSLGFGSKPEAFRLKGIKKAAAFAPALYPASVGKLILGTGLVP